MEPGISSRPARKHPRKSAWVFSFFLTALFLCLIGYEGYRRGLEDLEDEKAQILQAVGTLKAGQCAEWRKERLADAIRYARGPALIGPVLAFLANPDSALARTNAVRMLALNRKGNFYHNALLTDLQGRVLLAAEPHGTPLPEQTRLALHQALRTQAPALSRLHRTAPGQDMIDTAAPILDTNGTPVAALVLRSNASESLYPLIRFWPTASTSSEAILVTREGQDAVCLGEVGQPPHTANGLRIFLTHILQAPVQAVLGQTGLFHGHDYRGRPVLADLRARGEI